MPLCYRYDLETLCFVGAEEMMRNTLESEIEGRDIWILPAGCTETPPPEAKEGFKIKFNGEGWEYKKEPKTTFEIGETITDEDQEEYTAAAQWCNEHGAMIEEIGEKGASPRQFQIKKFEITAEALQDTKRWERNDALEKVMARIQRYQTQKQAGLETTETSETVEALLLYAQYLRDFPQQDGEWWNAPILTFEEWGAAQ